MIVIVSLIVSALGIPNLLFYLPATLGMATMALVAIDRTLAALRGTPRTDGQDPAGDPP